MTSTLLNNKSILIYICFHKFKTDIGQFYMSSSIEHEPNPLGKMDKKWI